MSATGRTKRLDPETLARLLADSEDPPSSPTSPEAELIPTVDADGKPVVDEAGKPVYVTRTERSAGDFYRTPAEVVEALIKAVDLPSSGVFLDLGSGDGAISEVLSKAFPAAEIVGVERQAELVDKARARGLYNVEFVKGNAHKFTPECGVPDAVVMNPPYGFAQEFAERALSIVRRGGVVCALLRLGFLTSNARREFHARNPCDVYVLTRRPSFTGKGKSDATEYGWFVWGSGRGGRFYHLATEKKKRAKAPKKAPKKQRKVPPPAQPNETQSAA